jgi:hypothetical protein
VSFVAITLCVASQRVFIVAVFFRYLLSPETFGYAFVFWLENLKGRDFSEDVGVVVEIILDWILGK